MSKVLVVQNEADEGLGLFEEEMKLAGVEWELIKAYDGDTIPTGVMLDEAGYRGLMVMGGPMSALDEKGYPFLVDELRMIRDGLDRKLPMLNVCLGSQLLARACGMPLKINGVKEVGWQTVSLVEWYAQRNPLFFQLPTEFTTFHWHQDTFEIPTEGYRLARSELYTNQAFCFGGNAYGLQFHPEVTNEMIQAWVEKDRKRTNRFLSAEQEDQMLSQFTQHLPAQKDLAHKIFYGWATLLRPADYRRPVVEDKPVEESKPEAAPAEAESAAASETSSSDTNQEEAANE